MTFFSNPDHLTPEEIAEALLKAPFMTDNEMMVEGLEQGIDLRHQIRMGQLAAKASEITVEILQQADPSIIERVSAMDASLISAAAQGAMLTVLEELIEAREAYINDKEGERN